MVSITREQRARGAMVMRSLIGMILRLLTGMRTEHMMHNRRLTSFQSSAHPVPATMLYPRVTTQAHGRTRAGESWGAVSQASWSYASMAAIRPLWIGTRPAHDVTRKRDL